MTNDFDISRLVAASTKNATDLLGKDLNEQAHIDAFLNLIEELSNGHLSVEEFIQLTKASIEKTGFVALGRLTLVDLLLWTVIERNEKVSIFGWIIYFGCF